MSPHPMTCGSRGKQGMGHGHGSRAIRCRERGVWCWAGHYWHAGQEPQGGATGLSQTRTCQLSTAAAACLAPSPAGRQPGPTSRPALPGSSRGAHRRQRELIKHRLVGAAPHKVAVEGAVHQLAADHAGQQPVKQGASLQGWGRHRPRALDGGSAGSGRQAGSAERQSRSLAVARLNSRHGSGNPSP